MVEFDWDQTHLGNRPPRFTSIKAQTTCELTTEGRIQNLTLQCELDWDADCSVALLVQGFHMGIHNAKISGLVVIELVGLISEPPMFNGLRVFFLAAPKISFEWLGASKIDILGALKSKIVEVMTEQITGLMVLPRRMGWAVRKDADIFRIRDPWPAGSSPWLSRAQRA